MRSPLVGNPLRSRGDLQDALLRLFEPLESHFSPGCARVRIRAQGTRYPQSAELEGFARPLWGLVPLAAGRGRFKRWDLFLNGISNGCDPRHPEYWGRARHGDQRLVEMAAFGFALALIPEIVWDPLPDRSRRNLVSWLSQINKCRLHDNNWLFFRVLVNLGLMNVGAAADREATSAALSKLDEFYMGNGWYADGPPSHVAQQDYYNAFAFHYYGLLYSTLADDAHARIYRERAADFANQFISWFAADGSAIPFGRSLTYRFAQGGFWGALAFAGVDTLPWGVLKGLYLRHLRWWAAQPIFNDDATLSIGYAYPNLAMAESYNSPGSPYWAFKYFLPLALPEHHPFWLADEAPLPDLSRVKPQEHPGLVICASEDRRHVFALSARQHVSWVDHAECKYSKFAYSTHFAFNVPAFDQSMPVALLTSADWRSWRALAGLVKAEIKLIAKQRGKRLTSWAQFLMQSRAGTWSASDAFDSTLALSKNGRAFLARGRPLEFRLEGDILYSLWQPWNGVTVETWLVPVLPWHVRIHRLRTTHWLASIEGGFSLALPGGPIDLDDRAEEKPGAALIMRDSWCSGIRELRIGGTATAWRQGQIRAAAPSTNLYHQYSVVPALRGTHDAGEHWLACAVLALPDALGAAEIWDDPPAANPAWLAFKSGSQAAPPIGLLVSDEPA